MANGRVLIGYSLPRVAVYSNDGSVVSYSNCMPLARGVDISWSVNGSGEKLFHADGKVAETIGNEFKDGSVTLTCDGLKAAAKALITGVATGEKWTKYGHTTDIVYCGFGCVMEYMEEGVHHFVPIVLTKIVFDPISGNAKTKGDEYEFQTQTLTAQLFRDDATSDYIAEGVEYDTEAAASAEVDDYLGA